VDARPGEQFEGSVFLISPSVVTATRSFNVAARVLNPEGKLKANSFARGELLLEKDVPTAVVPVDAVVNFAGISKVYVISNNVALGREIKAGRVNADRLEVLAGLKQGEPVAASGTAKLFDGAKVRVLAPQTETAAQ
jgi:membrane fusion protein (multidrug efflux system)